MTARMSTNFKQRLLGGESFADIFGGGRICIYSGEQPATADAAVTGTRLAQVTENGAPWGAGGIAGLRFAVSGEYVVKDPNQLWKLVGEAPGTAGWFRLHGPGADPGDLSYSAPRLDGTVGVAGGVELRVESIGITNTTFATLQQFLFSFFPPSGA